MADTTNKTGAMNPYDYARQVNETKIKEQELTDLMHQLGQSVVDSYQGPQILPGTGGKTAAVILAEQTGKLEAQQKAQETAVAADWDNLKIVLGQDMAAAAHQQRQLLNKVQQDSSVSFFDDPLLALANAFTLPWDQQALEATTQKIDKSAAAMQKINTHVQQSAATADVISTKITAGAIAETTQALASLSARTAAEAKLKAAQDESARLKVGLELDRQSLAAYMEAQRLRDMAEARAQRNEEFNLRKKKLEEAEKTEADMVAYANVALVASGKNPLDPNSTDWKVLRGSSEKYFGELVKKGMQITVEGKDWTHGSTIPERANWWNTVGVKAKTPQQDKIMRRQIEEYTAPIAPGAGTSDKKAWAAGADQRFALNFAKDQLDIGEGSPFEAPAWKVFAENANKDMLNHPIWRDYIHTTLNEVDSTRAINPQTVMNAAAQAVLDRKVPAREAAAFIKEVFDRAVVVNNFTHDFKRLTGGLEQKEFGARIETGVFGGRKPVVLTNETQVAAALAEVIASKGGRKGFGAGLWTN